ncbi:MAG: hypothetical protein ABR602_04745, partial [Gemmatimonadales bacterium]
TGSPPHTGASAQQIIMKIVTEEAAPVTKVRKAVPGNVAAAVAKALEKLPADRFASAADFARALADGGYTSGTATARMTSDSLGSMPWRRIAAGSVALALVLGALAGWALRRTDRSPRDAGLPPNAPMQLAGQYRTFTVARDGSFFVYVAKANESTVLRYHGLHSPDVRELPGTEHVSGTPRLSPDGTRVAFQARGMLKVASIAGGAVTSVGQAEDLQGGEWLADGTLFLGDRDGRSLR